MLFLLLIYSDVLRDDETMLLLFNGIGRDLLIDRLDSVEGNLDFLFQ